jgi:hypothetical protein
MEVCNSKATLPYFLNKRLDVISNMVRITPIAVSIILLVLALMAQG